MTRIVLTLAAAALVALSGCEGFREAMTAHVDVVARAGSQELSVERLAALVGSSKIPVNQGNARTLADLWVNYQLLGEAAARGDSLKDPKVLEEALWPVIAQERAAKWQEQVSRTWRVDTSAAAARYNRGDLLSAQHILFLVPDTAKADSVHRLAESVRAQVTSANFAQLARMHSGDPGSRGAGGMLRPFRHGEMVAEFDRAVTGLKPGEIAPGVVRTRFGYHIIRRPTFAEVKNDYVRTAMAGEDSTYIAHLMQGGNVQFKPGAVATIRKVIKGTDEAAADNTVIATSKAGEFTAKRMARWISAYPQREQMQLRSQVDQVPDSILVRFVRDRFIEPELLLHQADSAKVALTPTEMADLRNQFGSLVQNLWAGLGITPRLLADSAKGAAGRERVAAARVDRYMDDLVNERAGFVDVPTPVQAVLRTKYEYRVNPAGLGRAVERAQTLRAAADSARRSGRPPSQVPLQPSAPSVQPGQAPRGAGSGGRAAPKARSSTGTAGAQPVPSQP
jgi:peptidyl-prolyl cis-trans isomerase D